MTSPKAPFRDPLISAADLAARLGDAELLVVDCRFDLADPDKALREYAEAHIPGALLAHLDQDLSGPHHVGAGRHPLPREAAFSASLSRWGWLPGRRMVVYDAANGALAAARLWWLMRFAGQSCRVLDGGLEAWRAARLPLEYGEVKADPSDVQVHFDARHLMATQALEEVLDDATDRLLLDARAAPRYRGDVEPLDKVAGHVPGARNRPFGDNLRADGRFKSCGELADEFQALLGEHSADSVVHMCGSGVTACHNLLAMEHAGLPGSRLYAPSWSGWIEDAKHPVAIGSE